ncbi:MAG TPA: COX15/CtaA family protein [Ilumatobacter sp.]|nr:COX15/CtaA family protein [Ilumatobacter sp.]
MAIQLTPQRFRQVAIAALLMLATIIMTGAAVRLTGSGLGCDDWPRCSDSKFVDVSSKHTAIEQLNRLFTGAVGAAVIACVAGALGRVPRRRDLTLLAASLVVGVLANAVLGGISVLVELHPLAVQGHMLLSMALIVAATVLVRRAGEADGAPRQPVVEPATRRLVQAHFAFVCVAIVAGTVVTAAGPHAGDENAVRLGVAIPTAARLHGGAVILTVVVALAIAWRIRTSAADRRALTNPLSAWVFVACLQGALGYVQYFNGVPVLLVALHIAGATAVMLLSTQLLLATHHAAAAEQPAEAASGVPASAAV